MDLCTIKDANTLEVCVEVWGKYACFTRPENKVERFTYPCITPSAARNLLCTIYFKPIEFYYEVFEIEVINPIKYINIKKNEIKGKIKVNLNADEDWNTYDFSLDATSNNKSIGRTQRNTYYLKDVRYRIHAYLKIRPDFKSKNIKAFEHEFSKRVTNGKCIMQPYLGLSECLCDFSPPDENYKVDTSINEYIGPMLYDVFDITKNIPLDTSPKTNNQNEVLHVRFFDAQIEKGILIIPRWEDINA